MKRLFTILLLFSLVGFEVPHTAEIPDNAVGVWECPSIETTTPLYCSESTGQSIVDREDSAVFRWYGNGRAILDHQGSRCGKGEWDVNRIEVGSMAYLVTADKTEQYECVMVCKGETDDYSFIYDGKAIRAKSDEIICACCADDGNGRYIAVFKFMGVMPDVGG